MAALILVSLLISIAFVQSSDSIQDGLRPTRVSAFSTHTFTPKKFSKPIQILSQVKASKPIKEKLVSIIINHYKEVLPGSVFRSLDRTIDLIIGNPRTFSPILAHRRSGPEKTSSMPWTTPIALRDGKSDLDELSALMSATIRLPVSTILPVLNFLLFLVVKVLKLVFPVHLDKNGNEYPDLITTPLSDETL